MHIIERSIFFDAPCQWRAHHPAKQLGDVGVILRTAERHHHLGARAIPTGGQAGFEKHHADILVRIDARGFHLAHPAATHIQVTRVMHRMGDLAFVQTAANGALDYGQRCAKIGLGELTVGTVFDLHHQHRPDDLLFFVMAIRAPGGRHLSPAPGGFFQ